MMRAPGFWMRDGLLSRVLLPISHMVAAATARRVAVPGWRAPVPVVCCGNVGAGGAGKTTLALDLGARLMARGARPAFLARGYRGSIRLATRVDAGHTVADVGDEAMLLAATAPCWVGRDRAESGCAAAAAGATVLLMDDGLQNPGLVKDLSLLVIDGATGFGNNRVIPSGPLREPVLAAAARCHAAVLIGEDATGAAAVLPLNLPILRARLVPDAPGLAGRRVLAFAGIGRPSKFFETLRMAGAELVGTVGFPDHHAYGPRQLRRLQRRAERMDAQLVTTPKDAVRLPPAVRARVAVAGVTLVWDDPAQIEALLGRIA